MNLRDKILAADDLATVAIPVSEWDCTVYIKAMSTKEVLKVDKYNNENLFKLVILSCCDEEGNNIFSKDDVDLVLEKNHKVITQLMEEFNKLNGFVDTSKIAKN